MHELQHVHALQINHNFLVQGELHITDYFIKKE
jgi:hypothetical protein